MVVIHRLSFHLRVAAALLCAGPALLVLSEVPAQAQKMPKDLGVYIAEADTVCAKTNVALIAEAVKIETVKARSTRGGRSRRVKIAKPDDVVAFANNLAIPALTKLSADLRAIPIPSGNEKSIDGILAEFDKGIAALKKDPRGATFNDPLKVSAKAFSAIRFGEVRFTACGVHAAREATPKK